MREDLNCTDVCRDVVQLGSLEGSDFLKVFQEEWREEERGVEWRRGDKTRKGKYNTKPKRVIHSGGLN